MYSDYQRNWHSEQWKNNPEYRRKRQLARNKSYYKHQAKILIKQAEYYARRVAIISQLKNKPCMDCQGWFEPCQMDFDHRDPSIKIQNIGLMKGHRKMKTILEEIAKCDLVCANCHRLRTLKQNKAGLFK